MLCNILNAEISEGLNIWPFVFGPASFGVLTGVAMLTAILFVQETLLSAIPNIQLSVALIMIYGATLGIPKATLVMTVHVLLDNLIWGSLSPVTVCPMWVGWFVVILIGWLLRKAPLPVIVIGAVIGSLCYCWSFALFHVLFLQVNFIAYITANDSIHRM